jgi:WD40 repeat protein
MRSKNSSGMKWRGLGFCRGSLFAWAPPIQEQRLQSRFHEVIDYWGIQDALGAPARLCHRNSESRTSVAKRISGSGEPDPERSNQGSGQALATLTGHQGIVFTAAFSPDGKRVVTASDDHITRVFIVDLVELVASAEHQLPIETK